jgi:hypothetical protein
MNGGHVTLGEDLLPMVLGMLNPAVSMILTLAELVDSDQGLWG